MEYLGVPRGSLTFEELHELDAVQIEVQDCFGEYSIMGIPYAEETKIILALKGVHYFDCGPEPQEIFLSVIPLTLEDFERFFK